MTRILIEENSFAGIPALLTSPANSADIPLPTVIVWHGFTRSKELDSNLAFMMAQAGFRVLMPEADSHGKRFDGDKATRALRFWDILRICIDEMPSLYAELRQRDLILEDRVAVAGLSMGGFISLGAMARYEWLRTGVSWMGSAYFLDLARTLYPPLGRYDATTADGHESRMVQLCLHDPSAMLEKLANRPMMLWHGARDETVPFSESARLYADLVRQGLADNVEFIADSFAGHKLSDDGARAGVDFLRRKL